MLGGQCILGSEISIFAYPDCSYADLYCSSQLQYITIQLATIPILGPTGRWSVTCPFPRSLSFVTDGLSLFLCLTISVTCATICATTNYCRHLCHQPISTCISTSTDLLYSLRHSHPSNCTTTMFDTDRHLDSRPYRKKQKRNQQTDIAFDMAFFAPTSSSQFLLPPSAPARKHSQRFVRTRDEIDDFLSSDLEHSFASTVSLHSPPHEPIALTPDTEYAEPMDISPAPAPKPTASRFSSKQTARPRAFTSAARLFGNDISNGLMASPTIAPTPTLKPAGSVQSKRTQRSALPNEWLAALQVPETKPAVSCISMKRLGVG
jgi:hypothetical protein